MKWIEIHSDVLEYLLMSDIKSFETRRNVNSEAVFLNLTQQTEFQEFNFVSSIIQLELIFWRCQEYKEMLLPFHSKFKNIKIIENVTR